MFKKIINTFLNKVAVLFCNLLLMVLTFKFLGAEGRGEISLFITNIALVQLFSNFVGGGAIVYLTSRIKPVYLLLPSYLWGILMAVFIPLLLSFINQTGNHTNDLIVLSAVYNVFFSNVLILLGKNKVKLYNLLTFLNVFFLLIYFTAFIIFKFPFTVDEYISGIYVGYFAVLFISFVLVRNDFSGFNFSELQSSIRSILKYGFVAQISNLISFLNNRLSFYILNFQLGTKMLGVFSLGVAITESLWLMSKSIALVQYAEISNQADINESRRMTFLMAKFSFFTTLIFIIIVLAIPESFLKLIFNKEIEGIKWIILSLSLGVLSISLSTTFTHYNSGMGKYHINNYAALIAFVITILFIYPMTLKFGAIGAGITTSIAGMFSSVYQFVIFRKETGFTLLQLFPTREDFIKLKNLLKF